MRPRVLLCGRPDLTSKPGGDTRQIQSLARYLGPTARLSLELRPSLRDVDLVHLFNLSRPIEPALQLRWALAQGKPAVCTPIYQDLREYNRRGRHGAGALAFRLLGRHDGRLEGLRAAVNLTRAGPRALRSGAPRLLRALAAAGGDAVPAMQRWILDRCRLVLFNSAAEQRRVSRCVPGTSPRLRAATVPVGIDPQELHQIAPEPFLHHTGLEPGFVLSVGRVEDLKNQLGLLRALRLTRHQLVLLGPANPNHRGYARAVARAVARRPHTLQLGRLPRHLVLSAMAAAAVHVLPSWFETAGLTSLEAAALGCAVVSTDRGYAGELLGDEVHYCDPSRPRSIREAVERALLDGPSARLRQQVLTTLTEERAARATAEAYRQVVP